MTRTTFDVHLRARVLPTIATQLGQIDKTNTNNVHVLALTLFEQSVNTVREMWNIGWLIGPPDTMTPEYYAESLRKRARLYVEYVCRCDAELAAEIVQDVISRI